MEGERRRGRREGKKNVKDQERTEGDGGGSTAAGHTTVGSLEAHGDHADRIGVLAVLVGSSRWITWTYPSIKISATNQNRIRVASVGFHIQKNSMRHGK